MAGQMLWRRVVLYLLACVFRAKKKPRKAAESQHAVPPDMSVAPVRSAVGDWVARVQLPPARRSPRRLPLRNYQVRSYYSDVWLLQQRRSHSFG